MFILLIVVLFINFSAHPFYLSVSEVKYNSKSKNIEGSIKLFTNDFEAALKKLNNVKIDLINDSDENKNLKYIKNYVFERFKMSTSNTLINYKVIGYEPEGEAIWIYIESNSTQLTNQITFENSLLNDFIKEQTNIIHFEKDGKKYSGKLNNSDKTLYIKF